MLRWRRLFWLAQEAADETRSRDVVDARPKQACPGSFSGSGERLLSPFCVWGTGTPVEGTGSLMHSRSQGAKKVGGGGGGLCVRGSSSGGQPYAVACSLMHSQSQGGKATKEETRNSGLCARGWALHTAQVVETRTRTLSWKTLADFVQQLLVVLHLQRFNFGPTLAPLTRMIDGQRTRTPRVGIVLPLSQSPHCSAHDRPHTTK